MGITHAATVVARDTHELIAESVAYIVCSQFGLDLSLRSADYVDHWTDDLAAFRAGMTIIHDAAALLIEAVAPGASAGATVDLAA